MRLLLLLLFVPFIGFSQVVFDSINEKIYLDKVYEIELPKNGINAKAEKWIAKSYNNSNYVTKFKNEDNIIIKGSFKISKLDDSYGFPQIIDKYINYTLDLKFKDGRYKIDINNLRMDGVSVYRQLKFALMSFEQYKQYSIDNADDYIHGKKWALRRIKKKKFREEYENIKELWKSPITQIKIHVNGIDKSLYNYILSESKENDW